MHPRVVVQGGKNLCHCISEVKDYQTQSDDDDSIPKVCTNDVEELPRSLTPPLPPTEFARGGILI